MSNFWFNADESVPSCGDDEPTIFLVVLETGLVAFSYYIQPKIGRPFWQISKGGLKVTHWAFIPDVPEAV